VLTVGHQNKQASESSARTRHATRDDGFLGGRVLCELALADVDVSSSSPRTAEASCASHPRSFVLKKGLTKPPQRLPFGAASAGTASSMSALECWQRVWAGDAAGATRLASALNSGVLHLAHRPATRAADFPKIGGSGWGLERGPVRSKFLCTCSELLAPFPVPCPQEPVLENIGCSSGVSASAAAPGSQAQAVRDQHQGLLGLCFSGSDLSSRVPHHAAVLPSSLCPRETKRWAQPSRPHPASLSGTPPLPASASAECVRPS